MPYTRLEQSDIDHSRQNGVLCQQNDDDDDPEVAVRGAFTSSSSSLCHDGSFVGASDERLLLSKTNDDDDGKAISSKLHSRHSFSPEKKLSYNTNSGACG